MFLLYPYYRWGGPPNPDVPEVPLEAHSLSVPCCFRSSLKGYVELYVGYIGIMEKKMDTTTMGYIGDYEVYIGVRFI